MSKHNPKQQVGWFCPKCKKVSEYKENVEKHIKEKHEDEQKKMRGGKYLKCLYSESQYLKAIGGRHE